MRRLNSYLHVAAWQLGLAYVALWAITFVVLDYGPIIFDDNCRPVGGKLLFYWSCGPSSALAFAAAVANTALTVTVWAPVYVAAATVQPDATALALPILLVHLIGLPTALLVAIRLLARLVQLPRWLAGRQGQSGDDAPTPLRTLPPARSDVPKVKPRDTFGLRGQKS
jgi:hypothetical protein